MRKRILILLLILLIPLLVVVFFAGYLASGQVERQIERNYAKSFPGRLEVGELSFSHIDRAAMRDLRIYSPEENVNLRLEEIQVQGDIISRQIKMVTINGLEIAIQKGGFQFIETFISALDQGSDSGQPPELVEIRQSSLKLGSLHFTDLEGELNLAAPLISLYVRAQTEYGSMRFAMEEQDLGTWKLEILDGVVPVSVLLAAIIEVEPDISIAADNLALMPEAVTAAGTYIEFNQRDGFTAARIQAAWDENFIQLSCSLTDQDGAAGRDLLVIEPESLRLDSWLANFQDDYAQSFRGDMRLQGTAITIDLKNGWVEGHVLAKWKDGQVEDAAAGELDVKMRWDGHRYIGIDPKLIKLPGLPSELFIADNALVIGKTFRLPGIALQIRLSRDKVECIAKADAIRENTPLHCFVQYEDGGSWQLTWQSGVIPAASLYSGLVDNGLATEIPGRVLDLMRRPIRFEQGAKIAFLAEQNDLRFEGSARWLDGYFNGSVSLQGNNLNVDFERFKHDQIAELENADLSVEFARKNLRIISQKVQLADAILQDIPVRLSINDVLELVPNVDLQLQWGLENGFKGFQAQLRAQDAEAAKQVTVAILPTGAWQIQGQQVPLNLVEAYSVGIQYPQGIAEFFTVQLQEGKLEQVQGRVKDVALLYQEHHLAGQSGELRIRPLETFDAQGRRNIDIQFESDQGTRFRLLQEDHDHYIIKLDILDCQQFFADAERGKYDKMFSGRLVTESEVFIAGGDGNKIYKIHVNDARLDDVAMTGVASSLQGRAHGLLVFDNDGQRIDLQGQFMSGFIETPQGPLPIESLRLDWHADLSVNDKAVVLHKVKCWQRDAREGMSLSASGTWPRSLERDEVKIVADNVSLRWAKQKLPWVRIPDTIGIDGETSAVIRCTVNRNGVLGYKGEILPQGVDLEFQDGYIRVQGIRGEVYTEGGTP